MKLNWQTISLYKMRNDFYKKKSMFDHVLKSLKLTKLLLKLSCLTLGSGKNVVQSICRYQMLRKEYKVTSKRTFPKDSFSNWL
jgi:hypothetical protein